MLHKLAAAFCAVQDLFLSNSNIFSDMAQIMNGTHQIRGKIMKKNILLYSLMLTKSPRSE